jgi:hypothetical protein
MFPAGVLETPGAVQQFGTKYPDLGMHIHESDHSGNGFRMNLRIYIKNQEVAAAGFSQSLVSCGRNASVNWVGDEVDVGVVCFQKSDAFVLRAVVHKYGFKSHTFGVRVQGFKAAAQVILSIPGDDNNGNVNGHSV